MPPKRAKVTQKVQTNQTIQDLDEMNDQLREKKEYEEGAGRDDQKHAPDGGRSGHVEKVV